MCENRRLSRGKRTDNGKWVEGYYVRVCSHHFIIATSDIAEKVFDSDVRGVISINTIEVIPETVGEFTGLTDKNGTRIFEGDIVICRKLIEGNWIDEASEIGYVETKYGAFGLHRKQGYYRPFKDWLEDYEYEVIGNLHDNPELLIEHKKI